MQSTPLTCVRTRCRTSLVHTAVLHSYTLRVCGHCHWLHWYALLVCRQHRRPAFVRVAEAGWYALLSYIRTRCSYAVNTADLHSYALQNLFGTHRRPTFVHAARLPPLPLAIFVHAACPPSTSWTCVCTHCRTSLVHTAVLHSYMLRVYRHCRWLHSYALLVCRQHRRPAFVRVAGAGWYALISYIRTRCSYAVITADLRSYAWQNLVGTHRRPTFVHAARLPPLPLATCVRAARPPSTSSTCIRTCCRTLLVHTAVLHSYTLRVHHHYRWLHSYVLLVCHQHRPPAFVRVAEPRWYTPLSYIRTRCASTAVAAGYIRTYCSSVVNIVDLHWYALQNLVGTHRCPTFVHAARLPPLLLTTFVCATRLPSTSSTCIHTCCKTSLLHTALLHSYALLVCRLHR